MGTLSGASASIHRPTWSADGRWLAAPCRSGTIVIWDMADVSIGESSFYATYPRVIQGSEKAGPALAPIRVPAIGFAFNIGARLHYIPIDGEDAPALVGEHDGPIKGLASNGRYLATLGSESLKLWDPLGGGRSRQTATFPVSDFECFDLAWSAANHVIAVAEHAGIMLVDPRDATTPTFRELDDPVYTVAWAPDGTLLAAGTAGGDIYLWGQERQRPLRVLRGHVAAVTSVAFSCDGSLLASTSANGDVRLWTARDGQKCHEIPDEVAFLHPDFWPAVEFNPGANVLATVDSYDQLTVRLWSVRVDGTGPRQRSASEHGRSTRTSRAPSRGISPVASGAAATASGSDGKPSRRGWRYLTPLTDLIGVPPQVAAKPAADSTAAGTSARRIDEPQTPAHEGWKQPAPQAPPTAPALAPVPAPAAMQPIEMLQDRPALARTLRGPVALAANALMEHVAGTTGLLLPAQVYERTAAALSAGKHILFVGPPGTGKTTLARAVADFAAVQRCSAVPLFTAAGADWSTRETIGSEPPGSDGIPAFRPGLVMEAMRSGRWLVVDELQRASADRAFGELLAVLSGQAVELPLQVAGTPVRMLPCPASIDAFARAAAGDRGACVVHPCWRILATMNIHDHARSLRGALSMIRHFAAIDVLPPDQSAYRTLIDHWLGGDSALGGEQASILATALARLLAPNQPLMRLRPLGPALVRDMIAYIKERARAGSNDQGLLAEAFVLHAASLLEGLHPSDILTIHRYLSETFAGTEGARLLDSRVRALYPDIPADAWENARPARGA